jgi:phosphoribosylamine--glycine ligase
MDHKRALDGDEGLNTGGMGVVAPNPYYTDEIAERCMKEIFLPTIQAMNAEGRCFKGCLYFGLMITKNGPKVIEYNCRFGDPETQVVLPLMKSDLLTVMRAVTEERLAEVEVSFSNKYACCVILASKGYPEQYEKGFPLEIPETVQDKVYIAGAALEDNRLVTNGGRVVGCTAVAETLPDAIRDAYEIADRVRFENKFCRRDIGARALAAKEV